MRVEPKVNGKDGPKSALRAGVPGFVGAATERQRRQGGTL
jgi:hypothetical protein